MRFIIRAHIAFAAASLLAPRALPQEVSFGVIAGGYVNHDFYSNSHPSSGPFPTEIRSGAGGYIVGPSFELRLSERLSFEADALYKPLLYEAAAGLQNGVVGYAPAPVVTWQFPLLARYKLSLGRFRPFLEGGPSFRTTGNLNSSNPSHIGASAGVGIETQWRQLRFAPRLRYTRWAADASNLDVRTKPDQLELLAGFSYVPVSRVRPLGERVSLGLVVVSTVSSDIRPWTQLYDDGSSYQVSRARPRVGFGLAFDVRVSKAFSIEANVIPRSIRTTTKLIGADGVEIFSQTGGAKGMWEFPVLTKLRLSEARWEPFIALGPSFRLPKFDYPIYGATAGAGIETKLKGIKIAPAVRYTRWGPDRSSVGDDSLSHNQIQVLVGISF